MRLDASNLSVRPVGPGGGSASPVDGASAFVGRMADVLREVNESQMNAGKGAEALARGEATNLPRLMADLEESSLAFQMTLHFRNKVIEAYQEVMRMQI